MALDFSEFFDRYEKIVADVETVFEKVSAEHKDCVACGKGCSDCCYAMFDLTLVEALYLNHHFGKAHKGMGRTTILDRADTADREAYKFKRQIFKASQEGTSAQEILAQVASMRIRCPLLDEKDECALYEHRPITCRLYGIPVASTGITHTCGLSGFEQGGKYPTVNIDKLHDQLLIISKEIVRAVNSQFTGLHELLVPVSMAMITDFNEDYLGVKREG